MLFIKQSQTLDTEPSREETYWREQEPEEGHLAIDVYQRPDSLVLRSTIAGANPEDIEILIDGDMLTIRGRRQAPEQVDYNDFLYRECYWGKFSRTVILPLRINENTIESSFENGVLTIILPTNLEGDALEF